MALIRVAQYNSTPTVVGDYQAQNAHLQAFTNQLMTQQFILDAGTAQPVIKQGCYVSHGGSLYIADADTSITGSPSDGSVYIRVSGTTSLAVEFITSLSGYVWNPVYNAMTNGIYTLLPYMIVKAGATWTRFNFNPNNQSFGDTRLNSLAVLNNATIGGTLGVTGAISGASINTGQGATEVHLMNQNVRTTDSPTFAKLKLTTSTYGTHDIETEGTWVVPEGIYVFTPTVGIFVQVWTGSAWIGTAGSTIAIHGVVISDGSNIRLKIQGSTKTVYYRKFS